MLSVFHSLKISILSHNLNTLRALLLVHMQISSTCKKDMHPSKTTNLLFNSCCRSFCFNIEACHMFTTLYAYLWMLWHILPVSTIIWCMIPAGTVYISIDMFWRWCAFFHPLFDWTELSLFFFVMLRTIMRRYLWKIITCCKLFTL